MQRDPHSHKGENGKVAIIGGSRWIHGAPLFSALAAEASGVDLLFLLVPPAHEEVAKSSSLNFQVRTFVREDFSAKDIDPVLELLASMDSAVIGPGLPRTPTALSALQDLIASAPCPLVLDASALQKETLNNVRGKPVVLTPHLGELERMGIAPDALAATARDFGVTILLKGPTDTVFAPDGSTRESAGGNAGLTVGGTGDALAGLIAGLMAQGVAPAQAAMQASSILKRAGALLFEEQGFCYTTRDVIEQIPSAMRDAGSGAH